MVWEGRKDEECEGLGVAPGKCSLPSLWDCDKLKFAAEKEASL